ILRVDLQARLGVDVDEFVDPGGAVALFRSGVLFQVDLYRDGRVLQREVRRLVFAVVGVGEGEVGQPIEGEYAIRLGIFDFFRRIFRLQGVVVRMIVV